MGYPIDGDGAAVISGSHEWGMHASYVYSFEHLDEPECNLSAFRSGQEKRYIVENVLVHSISFSA